LPKYRSFTDVRPNSKHGSRSQCDPYTAVMSVERLTALLAALAPRRLGDIVLHGTLIVPPHGIDKSLISRQMAL
ncbi:MAG: hypothetical protein WAM53_02415, partial [Terrimicrobiaceae bacterium]